MGVWVSGFFGSGKSHFIKILSYLLANREVSHNGVTRNALSFFEEKIDDALLLADIRKSVQHPTDVVLFNIDSRANVEDGVDAILKVFLKVFNELAGYCGDFPHIAHRNVSSISVDSLIPLKPPLRILLALVGKMNVMFI